MLNELYYKGLSILKEKELEDAVFDCRILFEETADGDDFLILCRRRAAGEPLQYLVKNWEFYGIKMKMRPDVLIARPDTEILCERAIVFLNTRENPAFLELGCGSGALSIALAKHTGAAGTCIDLSPDAVGLTRENAVAAGVALETVWADLRGFERGHEKRFDLVVSNPPYLTGEEMENLQREVRREPPAALYGGPDGLDFYRYIIPNYKPLIKPGGALGLEIGHTQAGAVSGLCRAAGYIDTEIIKDYGKNDRVVFCRVWGNETCEKNLQSG